MRLRGQKAFAPSMNAKWQGAGLWVDVLVFKSQVCLAGSVACASFERFGVLGQ